MTAAHSGSTVTRMSDLVTVKTRVDKPAMSQLVRLAAANERSVAAEVRYLILQHLHKASKGEKP